MQLVKCKVDLKLRWTKHCVLFEGGTDFAYDDAIDNIIFIIKDTKLLSLQYLYQQKTINSYQKFLVKDFKDQFIEMKEKVI